MFKLKMLQPRLKEVDTSRGIKPVEQLKRVNGYLVTPPTRWTKAANGRTLPLNSKAWAKLRRSVLQSEPLCRMCIARGLTVVATNLDHRDNNPANNELVNLQPLCHECHSRKTAKDMGGNVRMGCDMSGTPVDPSHHWNQASLSRSGEPVMHGCATASEKSPATDSPDPTVLSDFNANCESVA